MSLCGIRPFVLAAGLLLTMPLVAGCPGSQATHPAGQERFYNLRGRVMSTDAAHGELTVAHGAVPGYMAAMTMPYALVNPAEMSEMHAGDLITARIVVRDDQEARLDHLVVVGQARPDTLPAVQYHIPTPGDPVPDFALLDQSGKTERLSHFFFIDMVMTFIYTRCPVADFCPRMSANFAEVDKALAASPAAYAKTHLLSVSFDPAYDTPAVLRSYGGAHTGRFTEEDFRHWSFAAPSPADLPRVEQFFNVGVTGSDPTTLTHSLSTLLIGKDGKVVAWYPTNDWSPAQVAEFCIRNFVENRRARVLAS